MMIQAIASYVTGYIHQKGAHAMRIASTIDRGMNELNKYVIIGCKSLLSFLFYFVLFVLNILDDPVPRFDQVLVVESRVLLVTETGHSGVSLVHVVPSYGW